MWYVCVSNEYYYILEIVYEKYIGILIGTLTWNCNVFTVCVVCVYVPLEFALDCWHLILEFELEHGLGIE